MPRDRFGEGEPVPACFALRNNGPERLGLSSRVEFWRPVPMISGGGASFDVRDRATGRSVRRRPLVDVPGDGFYCQRADLNRAAGAPVPPGSTRSIGDRGGSHRPRWRLRC
jgi:hypothetical protein